MWMTSNITSMYISMWKYLYACVCVCSVFVYAYNKNNSRETDLLHNQSNILSFNHIIYLFIYFI